MKQSVFFLLFAFALFSLSGSEPLKIAVISDIHFLGTDVAQPGMALQQYESSSGRDVSELHAVLDKVFAEITAARTNILLISGDITNHGERASHLEIIKKMNRLQEKGVRIFVVSGNHDINVPNSQAYTGDKPTPTQSISAEEFASLYADFGYKNALKTDTASLSYLSSINDSTWLLCFDTNRYAENKTSSVSAGRLLPQTLNWGIDILQEARKKKITVLGMMHHGLVEHFPYQATFFKSHLIENRETIAQQLADAGLQILFTGHNHANDISLQKTVEGNIIYDIQTGSLAQYPFPYRTITMNDKTTTIDTKFIDSIDEEPHLQEKYHAKMEAFSHNLATSVMQQIGFALPENSRKAIVDLMAKIHVLHAKGDETIDPETRLSIAEFAKAMGSEDFDTDAFEIDFPPADNRLVIDLGH